MGHDAQRAPRQAGASAPGDDLDHDVEEVIAAVLTAYRLPAAQRTGLIDSLRALTDAAGQPPVAPRPAPSPEAAAP